MTLTSLFLILCLPTGLACEDINVRYTTMESTTLAKALVYTSGRYEVLVSDSQVERPEHIIKESLVHELAHLKSFEHSVSKGNKLNSGHGRGWKRSCRAISKLNGVNPRHCSSTY